MKTRIPLICLLLLLAPTLFAESPTPLPPPSSNEYGIDPEKQYPGSLLLELLRVAEDEAASAVSDAFSLGFKEGRIDGENFYLPQIAALRTEVVDAKKADLPMRIFIGIGSFIGGSALTLGVSSVMR